MIQKEDFIEMKNRLIKRNVNLVIVTKKQSLQDINKLLDWGGLIIAENRVEEANTKFQYFNKPCQKHFIGRIQSRKIKEIVTNFDLIESIDSLEHLKKIDLLAQDLKKIVPVLFQVNTSDEPQKSGFKVNKLLNCINLATEFKNIDLQGVMTIATNTKDELLIRSSFRLLKNLFDKVSQSKFKPSHWEYLSMGMSNDYEIAIEEGSNMVRLGRVIFAPPV